MLIKHAFGCERERSRSEVCHGVWGVAPVVLMFEGYQLEFILHPDGSIILDFLSPEKAMFWSKAADELMETPYTDDKQPITWQMLKRAGIPFMS